MIRTVFQIGWLRLWNNKQELALTFIVPILFFSIFALIFSRGMGSHLTRVKVAIVDDDQSALTQEVRLNLDQQSALELPDRIRQTNLQWPIQKLAREILQQRKTAVVVHFPPGLAESLRKGTGLKVHLLREGTSPVASEMVNALLSRAFAMSLAKQSSEGLDLRAAESVRDRPDRLSGQQPMYRLPSTSLKVPTPSLTGGMIEFESTDVFDVNKHDPKIAMYAAGIAVMFLLFSASGAGGSLLEEHEAGTLDRLLTSQLTLTKLLIGKWLFIAVLGFTQLSVMFVWAQMVFGVDLFGHLSGFVVMAGSTAAATASLAICLAVFCRTRNQLNGISVVLILTMSALGGSMVPRFIMSEGMQKMGKLTFNGWALDGFKKVFWYDLPVTDLTQEVTVLIVMALYLAIVARVFADRWTVA